MDTTGCNGERTELTIPMIASVFLSRQRLRMLQEGKVMKVWKETK